MGLGGGIFLLSEILVISGFSMKTSITINYNQLNQPTLFNSLLFPSSYNNSPKFARTINILVDILVDCHLNPNIYKCTLSLKGIFSLSILNSI